MLPRAPRALSLGLLVLLAAAGPAVPAVARGTVVSGPGAATAVLTAPGVRTATGDPALTTDATGPLFASASLRPGSPVSRCLELTWTGRASTLGLSLEAAGDLAPYLDLRVDVGQGGGYDSCAGFVGTAVATAPLATLAAAHPDATRALALTTVTDGVTDGVTAVRVTVEVQDDDGAQGRGATADLTFSVTTAAPPPIGPPATEPPVTEPPVTDPPVTDPPVTDPPVTEPPVTDPPPQGPAPSEPPRPTVPPSAPTPDAPAPGPTDGAVPPVADPGDPTSDPVPGEPPPPVADDGPSVTVPLVPQPAAADGLWDRVQESVAGVVRDVGEALGRAAEQVREVVDRSAEPVAKGVTLTLWTLPMVLFFLLVQNRLDSRDPKLAQAPPQAAPSLPFDDTYPADTRPGGADQSGTRTQEPR